MTRLLRNLLLIDILRILEYPLCQGVDGKWWRNGLRCVIHRVRCVTSQRTIELTKRVIFNIVTVGSIIKFLRAWYGTQEIFSLKNILLWLDDFFYTRLPPGTKSRTVKFWMEHVQHHRTGCIHIPLEFSQALRPTFACGSGWIVEGHPVFIGPGVA